MRPGSAACWLHAQVVGESGPPSREVAQATLAAVGTVLGVLPPQPVTLTVLAPSVLAPSVLAPSLLAPSVLDSPGPVVTPVELYLTFGQLPPAAWVPAFPPVPQLRLAGHARR